MAAICVALSQSVILTQLTNRHGTKPVVDWHICFILLCYLWFFLSWISSVVMILQFLTLNMSIWFPMFWRFWSQVRGQDWPTCAGPGSWTVIMASELFNLLSYFLNCPKYCPGKRHFLSQVPHCLKVFKIKPGAKWAPHQFWRNFGKAWHYGARKLSGYFLLQLFNIYLYVSGVWMY